MDSVVETAAATGATTSCGATTLVSLDPQATNAADTIAIITSAADMRNVLVFNAQHSHIYPSYSGNRRKMFRVIKLVCA